MEEQMVEVEQQDLLADPLAPFREQVRAELAEKGERKKMSAEALAKFRAQRDTDKLETIGQERFVNALKSVVVTPENLSRLIARCGIPTPTMLDRRATKLMYWIRAGYFLGREIDTPALILFFSELTPDEAKMSDSQFAAEWDDDSAVKTKKSRIRREVISEDAVLRTIPQPIEVTDFRVTRNLNGNVEGIEYLTPADEPVWTGEIKEPPKPKYCKAGKQCIRYGMDEKRYPAFAVGKGDFCGRNCSESHKARMKRAKGQDLGVQEVVKVDQPAEARL